MTIDNTLDDQLREWIDAGYDLEYIVLKPVLLELDNLDEDEIEDLVMQGVIHRWTEFQCQHADCGAIHKIGTMYYSQN